MSSLKGGAYDKAAYTLWGEFSRVNFPETFK